MTQREEMLLLEVVKELLKKQFHGEFKIIHDVSMHPWASDFNGWVEDQFCEETAKLLKLNV